MPRAAGVARCARRYQAAERAGCAFPTIPPRVDYALTPLGRDLLDPVSALGAWAIRNQAKIARARERFDGIAR